ncbi:hypothetical protein [Ensifer adhaerens]|uniref:hypothetical protein n=1 Tax=Ensifer adhaerens TaxID=106592 RepID=UPI003CD02F8D
MRLREAYPWVVSFAFCLLHGFGFSGALQEIGPTEIGCAAEPLDLQHRHRSRQNLFVAAPLGGTRGRQVFNPVLPAGYWPTQSAPARCSGFFLGSPTSRSIASVFAIEGMTRGRSRPSV